MSPRRNRIEKVVSHRSKELDKRIAELADHKKREHDARLAAEREQEGLLRAAQSRLELAQSELSANDWIEANEWLRTRSAQAELAETQAAKARVGTERARAVVLHARTDLKKVEVLSERIGKEESAAQERADRRLEDELAALRFAADHKRDQR